MGKQAASTIVLLARLAGPVKTAALKKQEPA
jgi:hypothetical protein